MGASASIASLNDVTSEDICQMLVTLELPQYVDYIREYNIDGPQLGFFNEKADLVKYLNDIGIADEEHQDKIASILIDLKSHNNDGGASTNVELDLQEEELPKGPVDMHSAFLSPEALSAELRSDANGDRIEERGSIDGFGSGFTPLMAACYFGNVEVAAMLLDLGADVNSLSTIDKTTALMLASITGNAEIAELLLDREADINAVNNEGWTALMFACSNQFMSLASFLVERGASTDIKDKAGSMAVNLIIEDADRETFQVILDARGNA